MNIIISIASIFFKNWSSTNLDNLHLFLLKILWQSPEKIWIFESHGCSNRNHSLTYFNSEFCSFSEFLRFETWVKDKSFNCLDHVKDFSQIFTIWGLCEIPQVIFRKPNDFTHILSNHEPPKPSFQQHCPLHTHSDPRAASRQMIDLGWPGVLEINKVASVTRTSEPLLKSWAHRWVNSEVDAWHKSRGRTYRERGQPRAFKKRSLVGVKDDGPGKTDKLTAEKPSPQGLMMTS